MDKPLESSLHFDLEKVSPSEMLTAIQLHCNRIANPLSDAECPSVSVNISGARGQDFIGAGLRAIGVVAVQGAIGDFGFCSFGDGACHVEGNVGDFFGHSIASGVLLVRGHAKKAVGALGAGGLISIYGNAGDRTALGMQGADVVIRGSVGSYAGLGMQSGTLVLCGTAGKQLGQGMCGGAIYIRGEAESISSNIEEQRMREPDRLKIGMLLLKSDIKSAGKEFRVFRPVREEV